MRAATKLFKILKSFVVWLCTRGPGERTLKTGLAANLAWMVYSLMPGGTEHSFLGPLTAVLLMQTTVADSIVGAFQRVLAIVTGVAVAFGVNSLVGETGLGYRPDGPAGSYSWRKFAFK